MKKQLVVGFVRSPHGVTGEFKVESASGEYAHIAALKEVALRKEDVSKSFKVESAEEACSTLYMKLAGIESPEEAKKYSGWEIVVDRKYARPLNKNEWYIDDIIGCSLLYSNEHGTVATAAPTECVGTITDVLEGGGGYLLEVSLSESCTVISDDVKFTSAGKPRKVMVPFVSQHIGEVDVKNGTLQLMHLWILE